MELCYVPLYASDPGRITVPFHNIQSLHGHIEDVKCENLLKDLFSVCETWLLNTDSSNRFQIDGFRMYQQDGTSYDVNARPHHGLALYVKDFVNVNKVQYFTGTKVEFIVAKLSVGTDCLQFLTIYKAPQFKFHEFCMLLQQKCDHLIDLEKTLVITGDFISDIQKDK